MDFRKHPFHFPGYGCKGPLKQSNSTGYVEKLGEKKLPLTTFHMLLHVPVNTEKVFCKTLENGAPLRADCSCLG